MRDRFPQNFVTVMRVALSPVYESLDPIEDFEHIMDTFN